MDTLIIDGYSLLFRSAKEPETRTAEWVDRERLALIERITRMQAHLPRRIQLVFDGRESSRRFNLPSTRVELLYSSAAQSADLLIEELVRRHPDPAKVNVVSSDRRVVERAQILGARATTCSGGTQRSISGAASAIRICFANSVCPAKRVWSSSSM